MKFSHKLSCSIAMLFAVSFSVGGYFLVHQNFQDALDRVARQHVGQHLMEKYSLESELLDLSGQDGTVADSQIQRYGTLLSDYLGEQDQWQAVYTADKQPIYSSFPESVSREDRQAALDETGSTYYFREAGEARVMLVASRVEGTGRSLWLLSGYPVTALFEDRDRQMLNFWRMEAVVLVGSVIVIVLLSSRLTRPIRRLNLVSRKIASGAYAVRTGFDSGDEIGELGRNFDKMAQAVEQKMEALQQSLQQRDDFMGAFTHEIKTPMTSIIGYSDLLRSGEYAPEVRQKAANYIYQESKRLEALSQKLLLLMGLSDECIVPVPVQLNSLFLQAGRSALPAMEDVVPEFVPAGGLFVLCDRDLAVDLLRNLLLNAAKAEPKEDVVRVLWRREGERVRILVSDTGRGIPEDEVKRILEPFYMVDKSRARAVGGSGLGLSLCEKIARLHGDGLRIESRVGEGTTVSFTLEFAYGEAGI